MPKFKNVSPLGALDLPLIGRVVDPGEVFEVSATQARHLAGQDDTWQPVTGRGRRQDPEPGDGAPEANGETDGDAGTDPDAGVAGDDTQSEE